MLPRGMFLVVITALLFRQSLLLCFSFICVSVDIAIEVLPPIHFIDVMGYFDVASSIGCHRPFADLE